MSKKTNCHQQFASTWQQAHDSKFRQGEVRVAPLQKCNNASRPQLESSQLDRSLSHRPGMKLSLSLWRISLAKTTLNFLFKNISIMTSSV